MLFEDAFVTRDPEGLAQLFEDSAVLVAEAGRGEARGGDEIAQLVAAMWRRRLTYLADPQRVLQARDTGLVVAHGGINVVRRDAEGAWRYAISLLDTNPMERTSG